jgi:DNA mismatch repair protein MutS
VSHEQYLARLLRMGIPVAVCDQVEDAALAKGLVKREVNRVVTPGTVVDESLLDGRKPNRLAAIFPVFHGATGEKTFGLASIDLATGAFLVHEGTQLSELDAELARLGPSEIVIPEFSKTGTAQAATSPAVFFEKRMEKGTWSISRIALSAFDTGEAHRRVMTRFGTGKRESTEFKKACAEHGLAFTAAGALLGYLEEMQGGAAAQLMPPRLLDPAQFLILDETALRGLELTQTLRNGALEGSLLWTLDRTKTNAGARTLREWLLRPLRKLAPLQARQDAVAVLVEDTTLRTELRDLLRDTADLERIAARLSMQRATPRDLIALKNTLRTLPRFHNSLDALRGPVFKAVGDRLKGLEPLADLIEKTLRDDCPNATTEGGLIRDGIDAELDRLHGIAKGGKQWIADFETQEAERSGIPNLKVGYNRVFGYYIEITRSNLGNVPKDYERRQTLANAERYVTPALKERESEVLGAEEKIFRIEAQLFATLRQQASAEAPKVQAAGTALAELDALGSLAEVAAKKNYVKPELLETPHSHFTQMRHPVLEETLPQGTVVPSDLELSAPGKKKSGATPQILLLTGPNMAGKSTYIRATALNTILAQIGAFVPAEKASVGIADRIFTRIGAADDLFGGRSTFMLEMNEVAETLAHATNDSLVILDEVGRGTSTYDGVSLAWALVEHLHNGPHKPRTLFATHYHELCGLEEELPRVKNASALVKEWQGEITFLYRITPGPSERSFGLHAARLAGIPKPVIDRAKAILKELEALAAEHVDHVQAGEPGAPASSKRKRKGERDGQMLLFNPDAELDPRVRTLLDELKSIDTSAITPVEALARLDRLIRLSKGEL